MALAEFQKFIGFPYVYRNGPDHQDHPKYGINCQRFVHIFYRHCLEVALPRDQRSLEIYRGPLFRPVGQDERYWIGDVVCFGPEGLTDMRRLHLGVYIGDDHNEPLILHANRIDQGVSMWPLSEFANHPRYQELFGIRRYHILEELESML